MQEFFGTVQNIVGTLREYDKSDIMINELTEKIAIETNEHEKARFEVDKLYYQAQKYLLNKDAERLKQYLDNTIATINVAKGV